MWAGTSRGAPGGQEPSALRADRLPAGPEAHRGSAVLDARERRPRARRRATTAPDYLVRCLTRGTHALDPTIAHGWGIYDVAGGDWDRAALCAAVATGEHATVREASAALLGHEHSC